MEDSKMTDQLLAMGEAIRAALNTDSERESALVAAAMVDETMENLLRAAFVASAENSKTTAEELFDSDRGLGSMGIKLRLCRALGMIPPWMYRDGQIIRKIRNECAHVSRPVDLSTPPACDQITALHAPEYMRRFVDLLPAAAIPEGTARRDFLALHKAAREEPGVALLLSATIIGFLCNVKVRDQAAGKEAIIASHRGGAPDSDATPELET